MELRELFTDIAAAIRARDGSTASIMAKDFPSRIRAIPTGSDILLKSLSILTPPSKTSYTAGAVFNPAGMTFRASVGAGSKSYNISVPLGDVTFTPSGTLPAGTRSVTASLKFGSQVISAAQAVTVSGSAAESTPLPLTALLSDIAQAIRDKDGTSAAIKASSFPTRIRDIPTGSYILLQSLTILTPPSKTAYSCSGVSGEAFKPAGMTFRAAVGDGKKSYIFTVPLADVSFSPSGNLPAGTKSVMSTFKLGTQSAAVAQAVTVTKHATTWAELEAACPTWAVLESKVRTWAALEGA